jgi:hypothetical protein
LSLRLVVYLLDTSLRIKNFSVFIVWKKILLTAIKRGWLLSIIVVNYTI